MGKQNYSKRLVGDMNEADFAYMIWHGAVRENLNNMTKEQVVEEAANLLLAIGQLINIIKTLGFDVTPKERAN